MSRRTMRAFGLVGFLAFTAVPTWAGGGGDHARGVAKKARAEVLVDRWVTIDRPDGQRSRIEFLVKLDPPRPFPFEPTSVKDAPLIDVDRAGSANSTLRPEVGLAAQAAARGYAAFGERHDPEASEAEYMEAIRLEPDRPEHYVNRAEVHLAQGRDGLAFADFARAIELRGDKPAAAYCARAMAWVFVNQAENADADLDAAIRLEPGAPTPHVLRGLIRAEKGDLDGSRVDLDEAIRLGPSQGGFRIARVGVLLLKRDTTSALDALRNEEVRASAWQDQVPWADERQRLLDTLGVDREASIALLDRLQNFYPDSKNQAKYGFRRVRLFLATKEYQKAEEEAVKALQCVPRSEAGSAIRAACLQGQRQYHQALTEVDAGLVRVPADADLLFARAWILAACPDPNVRRGEWAVESARMGLKQHDPHGPETPLWYDVLAVAQAECGDFKAAIESEEQAIALTKVPEGVLAEAHRARLALFRSSQPYR